ncbi:MAG: aryl-sulfate sulfotransferase, partial [Cyanobacteria bacterium]|nr:aryl-sulfate sulfotransferase [Cyanobacteriota bacterium]
KIKNNKSRRMEAINFRTMHPLLSKDGSIVFGNGRGPLVKLDVCSNIEWISDRYFHHSIELNSKGNLVVPIVTKSNENYFAPVSGPDANPGNFQDDAFAEVSMENGKVMNETSITKILIENEYHNIVLQSLSTTDDLIHLNDAEPINFTDGFVREGDIMLSMRNTSSVALYRPSTNKIVWLQQGPWRQQHDIDYQGNGVFTIFGNDSYQNRSLRGYSTIYSYDIKTTSAVELLALNKPAIFTGTEGLHQIISENEIMIEETNKGIIHIMDKEGQDQLRYVSKLNKSYHSALHWSRFINDEDLISSVKEAKANSCPN